MKTTLCFYCTVIAILLLSQPMFASDQRVVDSLIVLWEEKQGYQKNLEGRLLMEIASAINQGEQKLFYARKCYNWALANDSTTVSAYALYHIAESHRLLGQMDSVVFYALKGLEENKKEHTNWHIASFFYQSIADNYLQQGSFSIAVDYYQQALQASKKAVAVGQQKTLDLASIHNNLGELHNYQGHFDSAMYYYQIALEEYQKDADEYGQAYVIGNMGTVYAQTNQHIKAKSHIDSAVQMLERMEDMYPIAVYLTYMADLYQQAGDLPRALEYLQESLSIAEQHDLKQQIRDAHQALAAFYKSQSLFDSAYVHQEFYFAYRDSLENLDNVKRIAEMRVDYEVSQKQIEVDLLNETAKSQRLIGLLLILGVCFALGSTVFFYKRNRERKIANFKITKQKEEISQQAAQLQEFNEELSVTNDMLKDNQIALESAYGKIQEEQLKSESLLLNVLPEAIAAELKEKGRATPKHYELASVLFTDFKGFTQLAEKMTPEAVIEELSYCYGAFDELCGQYNIEKIKTIGDAYMCVGGIPASNTSNPIDIIRCALAMQQFMEEWKANKQAQGLPVWDLRLGIHTGELIAGVVGTQKFSYDVWGDTVNIASRMESSGEPGKINISSTTYELVKEHFTCEYRGKIQAKNKGEIEMYFVLEEKNIA